MFGAASRRPTTARPPRMISLYYYNLIGRCRSSSIQHPSLSAPINHFTKDLAPS